MAAGSVAFLEKHLPARAAAWELAALQALTEEPRSLFPWPWVELALVPEPHKPQPQAILRLTSDLGHLTLAAHAPALLTFRVCVDNLWVGMLLPEHEAYALIVEGIGITSTKHLSGTASAGSPADPHVQQFIPKTPAPGYTFADPDAPDWTVPLYAGDTVAIGFRNTSDAPLQCRVLGTCLVFRAG